jgi:plasmid stabilization system protein ParE
VWYEDRQSGLGRSFLAAADRTMETVARRPHSGTPIEDLGCGIEARRMAIGRFPYYAAYVVHHDSAVIVAIAHERRRPRYWIDRLD